MSTTRTGLLCPFDLDVSTIARMLNAEIADHPIYEGIELQWFDDDVHGTGMLAFVQRRADRRVDYYVDPALRLDRSGYAIGGGTGAWTPTRFDVARLDVATTGVVADVRFTDVDGRRIEVRVDDSSAGRRHSSELLAPVSSGIDAPTSLLLVYLHGFDLVRRAGPRPVIRIGGQTVSTGTLPGGLLHRRHLVKAAAPLTVATLCGARSGPLPAIIPAEGDGITLDASGTGLAGLRAHDGQGEATFELSPPLPALSELAEGATVRGRWRVSVDAEMITGGEWHAVRRGDRVELGLEVTEPWVPPAGLPLLMRVVTRVIGVFRQWPKTYRWQATVTLADDADAHIESRWERTGSQRGAAYRRATRS